MRILVIVALVLVAGCGGGGSLPASAPAPVLEVGSPGPSGLAFETTSLTLRNYSLAEVLGVTLWLLGEPAGFEWDGSPLELPTGFYSVEVRTSLGDVSGSGWFNGPWDAVWLFSFDLQGGFVGRPLP